MAGGRRRNDGGDGGDDNGGICALRMRRVGSSMGIVGVREACVVFMVVPGGFWGGLCGVDKE